MLVSLQTKPSIVNIVFYIRFLDKTVSESLKLQFLLRKNIIVTIKTLACDDTNTNVGPNVKSII